VHASLTYWYVGVFDANSRPTQPSEAKAKKRKRRETSKEQKRVASEKKTETSKMWTKTYEKIEKLVPLLAKDSGMLLSSDDSCNGREADEDEAPAKRARR